MTANWMMTQTILNFRSHGNFLMSFMMLCVFIMRGAMRLSSTKRMNWDATVMKNRLLGR